MPTNITPLNKFTTPITVPVDGDPVSFAQREPSLQALADRSLWSFNRGKAVGNIVPRLWRLMNTPGSPAPVPYAWSPALLTAVGTASSGVTGLLKSSSDGGDTWTSHTTLDGSGVTVSSMAWSDALALFVAVAFGGSNFAASSPDGITWTVRTLASHIWRHVIWAPELAIFVTVGGNSTVDTGIATSTNGTAWTSRTSPVTGNISRVAWSSTNGKLVGIVSDGAASTTPRIVTSSDGVTWSVITLPAAATADGLTDVAWAGDLGMFVVTAGFASWASPDGVTWTVTNNASSGVVASLMIWVPDLLRFVGLSSGPAVITSLDGSTWQKVTVASAALTSTQRPLWAPDISRLMTVGCITI